jgi:hypothetical protein
MVFAPASFRCSHATYGPVAGAGRGATGVCVTGVKNGCIHGNECCVVVYTMPIAPTALTMRRANDLACSGQVDFPLRQANPRGGLFVAGTPDAFGCFSCKDFLARHLVQSTIRMDYSWGGI